VYGIAEQANGHITVESEPNLGTTFRIYLPRVTTSAAADAAVTLPPPVSGHQTLLLAEDEAGIRNMTRVYLENLGYTVLEAADGNEALHISRQYNGVIDLLVTDVIMPGVRGDDLARILRHERPKITVLFISGFAELDKLDKSAPIVEKPFTFPELGRRIHDVLAQNREMEATKPADERKSA
jgi:DNA-binding response OmpR family regulator